MNDLKGFIKRFNELYGEHEFDPELFDGLEALVDLSGPDFNVCGTGRLKTRVVTGKTYKYISINTIPFDGFSTSYKIYINDIVGNYCIREETKAFEFYEYQFYIKDKTGCTLMINIGVSGPE